MADSKVRVAIFEDAEGGRFFHFSDFDMALYPAKKKGGNLRIIMNAKEDEFRGNTKVREGEIGGDIADAMLKIYQAYSDLKEMDELITLSLSGVGGLLGKILG